MDNFMTLSALLITSPLPQERKKDKNVKNSNKENSVDFSFSFLITWELIYFIIIIYINCIIYIFK